MRMTATRGLAAAGLALLLLGCGTGSGGPTPADDQAMAEAVTVPDAAVRAALAKLVGPGGPPGALVRIQSGSAVVDIAEGSAQLDPRRPMTPTDPMRIASVSKAFSGALVLALVQSGQLGLADPIGDHLPDLPKAWRAVTVAQLLNHTSGLPDYIRDEQFRSDFVADPRMTRLPRQLVEYVADQQLLFPAGSRYEYSDTDNIVIGLIAEQVSGQPYEQLLGQVVLEPLGLSATSLPATPSMPAGYVHGYAEPEQAGDAPADVSEFLNPALAWASGGMLSTAADLNTFIRAYAAGQFGGQELSVAARRWVPGAGGPPGPGVNSAGAGIYRYEAACGTFLGHTGNMPGYTQFVAATPDGRSSVVVSTNAQVNPAGSPELFDDLLSVQEAAVCAAVGQTPPTTSPATPPTTSPATPAETATRMGSVQ